MADPDERLTVLGPHVHDGVRLSEAAAASGVPERTARRWLAAYEESGTFRGRRAADIGSIPRGVSNWGRPQPH